MTDYRTAYVFEFRIWCTDELGERDHLKVKDLISPICKKGTFALEQAPREDDDLGKGDGLHYQGIISLRNRKNHNALVKGFKDTILKTIRFRPVCNETKERWDQGDNVYWGKDHTILSGPWDIKEYSAPTTTQLDIFNKFELYPWQATVKSLCEKFEMRKINLIWDTTGNAGKSLFLEYLEYNKLAEEVPPFRLMEDIFQWVYGYPGKNCYIFDMPRGMKKDKLGDFYSGIEVIKNGVAYDKRNFPKKVRFNRPIIFVFTNTLPCLDLMSKDRWVIWEISKDKELINITDNLPITEDLI